MKLNPLRHFYLFAKGHYPKKTLKEDMMVLQKEYSGISTDLEDVIGILSNEVWKHINNNEHKFFQMIERMNPDYKYKYKCYDYYENVIEAYLYILHFTDVKDIEGGLGKYDPTLFSEDIECEEVKEEIIFNKDTSKNVMLIGLGN